MNIQSKLILLSLAALLPLNNVFAEANAQEAKNATANTQQKTAPVVQSGKQSFRTTGTESDLELSQKLNNPVAALILAPIQINFDFSIGEGDGWRNVTNFQPVIPFQITEDLNLITRTIVPYIYQHDALGKHSGTQQGISDTTSSFFFSPIAKQGEAVWGVGPAFLIPTATTHMLGTEKWGAGPSVILLKQTERWTYGGIGNHIWSFAGSSSRDYVSLTFVQPFVSYVTSNLWTLLLTSETTYDWNNEEWTVPIDIGASHLVSVGGQKMNLVGAFRSYAVRPDGGPDWGVRFVIVFIL